MRLGLVAAGTVVAAAGAVLTAVVASRGGAVLLPAMVVGFGFLAIGAGATTRGVHEISVGHGSLRVAERDGTILVVPLSHLGGIGHRGFALGGQLVSMVGGWQRTAGRVVVHDPYGRTIASRIAGGMALADLAELCARSGIRWLGRVGPAVPVVAAPPPTWDDAAPPDPAAGALDDPATASGLRTLVGARRRRLGTYVALVVLGIIAGNLTGAVPRGSAVSVVLGWTCGLGVTVGLVLLAAAPLNEDRPIKLRRALRSTHWELVELVVLDGRGGDQSGRAVGVCSPGSAFAGLPESWWKVVGGGRGGWLQGDVRRWGWIARDPSGSRAVVASLDRSLFGRLSCTRSDRGACTAAARAYLAEHELAFGPVVPGPGGPPAWPAPAPQDAVWLAPPVVPAVPAAPVLGGPPPGWVPPPAPLPGAARQEVGPDR